MRFVPLHLRRKGCQELSCVLKLPLDLHPHHAPAFGDLIHRSSPHAAASVHAHHVVAALLQFGQDVRTDNQGTIFVLGDKQATKALDLVGDPGPQ